MSEPLKPQSIRNLVNGVIRQAEVDDNLLPVGAVTEAVNFHFDRKGAPTSRLGIATLGATIALKYPIWGLFNVNNGTMLATVAQGGSMRVYAFPPAGAWTSNLTSGTANAVVRFLDFAGVTTVLNWGTPTNQYSTMQFWTGRENNATWTATGNPINPQQVASNNIYPKYGEIYKSRMYLSGDANYPSRLFFSSVISTAGNITWTPTTDFVDINPGDGEDNTALKRYSLELLFFKPNYIYRFRTSGVDPDPIIKIGTRSNESVVEGKRALYFHHETGFYSYTGSYPTEISRPIIDIVEAIPYSQYSIISGWADADHVYWSLGNITPGDTRAETPPGTPAWTNVVVRYTESSGIWTIYSYSNNIKLGTKYNSGTALSRVLGLDNGVVATLDSGNTDLGEAISYRLITRWYEWEDIATRKVIQEAIVVCEKAQEMHIMYQTDGNLEWRDFGTAKSFRTYIQKATIPFYRIRFKLAGLTKVESTIFKSLEILGGNNDGFVR